MIEYKVSQDGQRIDTFPKGILDIRDTIDYFNRLKNDKRIKKGAIEVVYFNHVTDFKISYLESYEITQSYQLPKTAQMIEKTIFVCNTDLAFGMGKMLQALHILANPDHKVEVLRAESELKDKIDS